jgi:hypothetical protein
MFIAKSRTVQNKYWESILGDIFAKSQPNYSTSALKLLVITLNFYTLPHFIKQCFEYLHYMKRIKRNPEIFGIALPNPISFFAKKKCSENLCACSQ